MYYTIYVIIYKCTNFGLHYYHRDSILPTKTYIPHSDAEKAFSSCHISASPLTNLLSMAKGSLYDFATMH
ncbi:hypothetical protein PORCRE_137 [Porphyromonas crevioricanis JCM 15906]|uniref:Uncharacterized protein n=1 Tax=Porphyromonas crevioricanis JCM 15906 TaxID=1305617 RepID=S4N6M6_9PORP|nr:hypothetical protein PORCRE_137 [Porphyromonas crevioricanis JCM 15906]GAD07039.1 hypothetical protein PORCAN_652 [Porphyromonas crevioricanis JCM 13913]